MWAFIWDGKVNQIKRDSLIKVNNSKVCIKY